MTNYSSSQKKEDDTIHQAVAAPDFSLVLNALRQGRPEESAPGGCSCISIQCHCLGNRRLQEALPSGISEPCLLTGPRLLSYHQEARHWGLGPQGIENESSVHLIESVMLSSICPEQDLTCYVRESYCYFRFSYEVNLPSSPLQST